MSPCRPPNGREPAKRLSKRTALLDAAAPGTLPVRRQARAFWVWQHAGLRGGSVLPYGRLVRHLQEATTRTESPGTVTGGSAADANSTQTHVESVTALEAGPLRATRGGSRTASAAASGADRPLSVTTRHCPPKRSSRAQEPGDGASRSSASSARSRPSAIISLARWKSSVRQDPFGTVMSRSGG